MLTLKLNWLYVFSFIHWSVIFLKGNMVESSEPVIDKEEKENIQTEDENNQQNGNKKNRPTPETVAMDRGVQNIARKAHKNSKGDDKKLGMSNILLFYCFPLFLCNTISEKE